MNALEQYFQWNSIIILLLLFLNVYTKKATDQNEIKIKISLEMKYDKGTKMVNFELSNEMRKMNWSTWHKHRTKK